MTKVHFKIDLQLNAGLIEAVKADLMKRAQLYELVAPGKEPPLIEVFVAGMLHEAGLLDDPDEAANDTAKPTGATLQ